MIFSSHSIAGFAVGFRLLSAPKLFRLKAQLRTVSTVLALAIVCVVPAAVLAQSATIGSLTTDDQALLRIDNGSAGQPEALRITGLPEANDSNFSVLVIENLTDLVRSTPLSTFDQSIPTADQVMITSGPNISGDSVQAALDALGLQVSGFSNAGFENLATSDLLQDPEDRLYDLNGFDLTWENGGAFSVQGDLLTTQVGPNGELSIIDTAALHATVLEQGSIHIGRDGSGPIASDISLFSEGGNSPTAQILKQPGSNSRLEIANFGI